MDQPMSDAEAAEDGASAPAAPAAFSGWSLPPASKYKLHSATPAPAAAPPVLTSSYGQQTNPAPAEVEIRRTASSRAFAAAMGEARNWTQEFNAILRDYFKLRGTIPKLLKDFEDAATAIGRTIISERNLPAERKSIPPLAKGELGVAGGEKYLCGSIFFKYAVDLFGIYGSDHYAQKAAGLELKHLNTLFSLGRICSFPLMCIIDYRGWRLIASSVLPIRDATIVYGSNDQGQTVHTSDASFNQMMHDIGRKLNLKPHLVRGTSGALKEIVGPIDIEGHIGDDGNRYLVDYQRLMPPETPNGMQGVHLYRLLRPELVRSNAVPLSSDAFSTWGGHDGERHNNEVNDATTRLRVRVVPEMAARIAAMDPNTVEPVQLITGVQRQGINVRYLGLIADALPPAARSLLLLEMIARTLRSALHEQLRKVSSPLEEEYKASLVQFLNLAFGRSPASDHFWRLSLVQELNTRFISTSGRPLGSDPRPEISMERLLSRLEELSGVALLPSVHARLTPEFLAHPAPFTTADIFAMEPRVKRMTSWLDPRAFQVTGGLKEEAEGAVVIDNSKLTGMKFLVEGVTGNIYRAKWNGQDVAMTQFHNDNEFKQFLTVVEELCTLSHPHLVRIFGLVRNPGSCVAEFIDGGTLDSFLEDEDNELTWPLRFRLAEQIAQGMLYLHGAEPPFVHRNLTAPNILLTRELSVKINTVRLTRHVGFSCDTAVMGLIPPEIVEEEHWSEKSDVYCFGIILWQLVMRDLPDLRNDLIPDLPATVKCPADYLHILHICLERHPAKRPTFHEIHAMIRHGSVRTSME